MQWDRLARVLHSGDANQIVVFRHAGRGIEIDPARTGYIDLDPSVGVATVDLGIESPTIFIIIDQMYLPGDETRRDTARAKRRNHKNSDVAATSTP